MSIKNKNRKKNKFNLGKAVLKSAKKNPEVIALEINSKTYTYSDLVERALKIKQKLKKCPDSFIGVRCDSTIETYSTILGILIAGKAYVPIHSSLPKDRLLYIIKAVNLKFIVGSDFNLEEIAKKNKSKLNTTSHEFNNNKLKDSSNEIAYVLSTSGSTGKPKIVPIKHENLKAFFEYFLKNYNFQSNDVFLQAYELNFDVSVFCIFMPWLIGAKCVVLPDKKFRHFEIIKTIENSKVSVCSMVPGVLELIKNNFCDIQLPSIRYSFFSGDALIFNLAKEWGKCIPNGEIHNFYGPTETTIVCSRYIFEETKYPIEFDIVPLGKSFPGTKMAIYKSGKIVHEAYKEGEIIINGKQVFNGYLGIKEKKAFVKIENKYWYKTGDRGLFNKNGEFHFLGRKDRQFKRLGFRIEPAEIESIIRRKYKIRNLALQINKDLILVIESNGAINENLFIDQLSKDLPYYMLPNKIIRFKNFPVNQNGKIDVKKIIEKIK